MLDATEGVTDQDATVLGAVLDAGRALVIAINKWDGLTEYQREQAETMLSLKLGFVPWAESVRISAKHGSGLRELFRAVHRAHESANKTFTTSEVNKALKWPTRPTRRRPSAATSPSCATCTRPVPTRRPSSCTAPA